MKKKSKEEEKEMKEAQKVQEQLESEKRNSVKGAPISNNSGNLPCLKNRRRKMVDYCRYSVIDVISGYT